MGFSPALTKQLISLGQSFNTGNAKLGLGHRLVTQHSGRLKPEDTEFKVNVGYIATYCQKERRKTMPEL